MKRIRIKETGRHHNFQPGDLCLVSRQDKHGVWARQKFGKHYGVAQLVYFFQFDEVK